MGSEMCIRDSHSLSAKLLHHAEHVQKFKVESEEESKRKHLSVVFLPLARAVFPMPEESFS